MMPTLFAKMCLNCLQSFDANQTLYETAQERRAERERERRRRIGRKKEMFAERNTLCM